MVGVSAGRPEDVACQGTHKTSQPGGNDRIAGHVVLNDLVETRRLWACHRNVDQCDENERQKSNRGYDRHRDCVRTLVRRHWAWLNWVFSAATATDRLASKRRMPRCMSARWQLRLRTACST